MKKIMDKMYFKSMFLLLNAKKALKSEKGGTGIIEIIVILAIVIILAVVFRSSISSLFSKIWNGLFNNVDNAIN